METISRERQGQIALAYLKYEIRKNGVPTFERNVARRKIHDAAKGMGITFEEAERFVRGLMEEVVQNCFPGSSPDFAPIESSGRMPKEIA